MSALSSIVILDEPLLGDNRLVLRSFRNSDQSAVSELLHTGLLAGHIDPLDASTELAYTEGEYLSRAKDHFWVAEVNGSVVGTVALAIDRLGVAHVRRLRVAPAWQFDTATAASLVRIAAAYAREHDCMELVCYAPANGIAAIEFLRHLGFRFGAERNVGGVCVLEFYNNLRESGLDALSHSQLV